MKVTELVDYYYNPKSEMISVKFRIDSDSDEEVRQYEFEVDEIDESGFVVIEDDYNYESSDLPFSYEEDTDEIVFDEDEESKTETIIDENELSNFLVYYFENYPKKLPGAEFF